LPLNVVIAINDTPIQAIKISRLTKLKSKAAQYPYMVEAHDVSALFSHYYNDGAEECLRRALEALAAERERLEKDS
jgi:hypothetical protein